jgi:hypothetical protein
MIQDNFALTGALTIAINDAVVQETDNLVVDSGKKWVARMMKAADGVMTHMAIGTDGTGALAANTGLGTELERNALTVSGGTVGTGADANTIAYACTFPAGDGTGAIKEAGLFENAGNKVDDVNITAEGTGYTSVPTVVFTGGGYTTTAAGTAVLTAGKVTSVTITAAGAGYTSAPTMTFTGGGGSGAAATATLKEGGDMLARTDFAVVNKGAADSMTITWTITVS